MTMKSRARTVILTVVAILLAPTLLWGVLGSRPEPLGVQSGRLLPCPETPNCVLSFGSGEHSMEAIPYVGRPEEAMDAAVQTLAELPRTSLLNRDERYARFAVRSEVLRFVDDVEILVTNTHVHFRSAARLGEGDFGVNRDRMTRFSTELRERLEKGTARRLGSGPAISSKEEGAFEARRVL